LLTNATLALLLTTALFFLFPTLGRRSACRRWRTPMSRTSSGGLAILMTRTLPARAPVWASATIG